MKKVRFIHAADLHLDSPMFGLKDLPEPIFNRLKESTFSALRKMIDIAIEQKVDFVILAGDLYDGEDRSIRAQARFRKEMERLHEKSIPVYVVHGNHDHTGSSWTNVKMPENVHTFKEKVEVKVFNQKEVKVHLYGFSYPKRHVTERKIDEYKKLEGADFHIGLLHGNLEGNLEHGNYAPFQLKDLLSKEFDYWALGHIHKRAILSEEPPVVYPGNLQARHKKESGTKGFYLVTMTSANSQLEFIESSDVIWEECVIEASYPKNFNSLYELCRKIMEQVKREDKGVLLNIALKNVFLEDKRIDRTLVSELLEILKEEEGDEKSFVWPVKMEIEEAILWDRKQLSAETDFFAELFHVMEEEDALVDCTSLLYKHPLARKYLDELTELERDELIKDAEKLLVGQLLDKR